MLSGDKLKKEHFYLPVTQENEIDWAFMESYIKKLFNQLKKWEEYFLDFRRWQPNSRASSTRRNSCTSKEDIRKLSQIP